MTDVTVADHIEFDMLMPLGLGVSPNGGHGSWQKKHRITKGIRGHVADVAAKKMARLGQVAPERKAKLRLVIIWPANKRRLEDTDNIVARCKPILDGLRDARLLVNDSPTWLDFAAPAQVKSTVPVLTLRVVIDYA